MVFASFLTVNLKYEMFLLSKLLSVVFSSAGSIAATDRHFVCLEP